MRAIPRDTRLDSTLALARDGYEFIPKRAERLGSDVFETRLLLRRTICMTGEDAARTFYDEDRFRRSGAAPRRAKETLFGTGGVQGLDGGAHHRRKRMFMSLMTPEGIADLVERTADQWHAALGQWETADRVVLFDELQEILCRAVFSWADVPLDEADVARTTADIAAMIEGAGAVGPRHWRGRLARNREERRLGRIIDRVRSGELEPAEESALAVVARHRDPDGDPLDRHVAAVELLNVLRPTVAVARFIVFMAMALHEHPEHRSTLRSGDEGDAERFVQEVRRFYPFFPFAVARVRRDFEWRGYRFPRGTRTLLDLYGTDRDPRTWNEPGAFRPERFRDWDGGEFDFIPQGGGDHYRNHRCPGEWITIAIMKRATGLLTRAMRYDVPPQDLRIRRSKMPPLPNSRFIIRGVERVR